MRAREATLGRAFVVALDHGDDFISSLTDCCRDHDIRQAFIPSFIAGFSSVDLVGTCEALDDPKAPVWTKVQLKNVEALGGGSIAYDEDNSRVAPHIHVAVGLKEYSATGHTSHLLSATVQFLTEMLLVEISTPQMNRVPDARLYDVPLLRF